MVDWGQVGSGGEAPVTAPSGGSGVNWGAVGGGAAATSTSPTATSTSPAAPKAATGAKKGGGGLLGLVSRQVKEGVGMVTGVPKGLLQLGKDSGRATVDTAEKAANTVASPFTKNRIGGDAYARDTSFSRQAALAELHDLPAVKGMIRGAIQTGRHVAGNVQGLADVATAPVRLEGAAIGDKSLANVHPLGHGLEKQLIHDYATNPLGSAVNDAANISIAAGPVAAGLEAGGLEGAASGVRAATAPLGKLASAPVEPWMRAASPVLEPLAGAVNNARAGRDVELGYTKGAVLPKDIAWDTRAHYDTVPGSEHEFGAGVLRAGGMDKVLAPIASDPLLKPFYDSALARLGAHGDVPTDEAVRAAQQPTDNVKEAEAAVRGISDARTLRNVKGFGLGPDQAALNEAQTRMEPMQHAVDKLVEPALKARDSAVAKLRALPEDATDAERNFARYQVQQANAKLEEAHANAIEDLKANPRAVSMPVQAARELYDELTGKVKSGFRNGDPRYGSEAFRTPEVDAAARAAAAKLEPLTHFETWYKMAPHEQPVHLIGDASEADARQASGRGPRGKFVKTKAGYQAEGTATAYSKEGQVKLEAAELNKAARNRGLQNVINEHAATPRQLLGPEADSMDPREIDKAMRDQLRAQHGVEHEPLNPHAGSRNTLGVEPNSVTADTPYVPHPVLHALEQRFPKTEEATGLPELGSRTAVKALDAVTRYGYRNVISMFPSYVLRRLVGNTGLLAAHGVPAEEMIPRIAEAIKDVRSDQAPASLMERLNSETEPTLGNKVSRTMQVAPRNIDAVTRQVLYKWFRDQGNDYETATAKALQATGERGGQLERNVFQRAVPGFSWGRTVLRAGLDQAAAHPAAALTALNIARMARERPQEFKTSPVLDELNPLSIFTLGGGLVNPVLRGAIGATTGFNPATMKDVTRPSPGGKAKPLTGAERRYFALNQLPLTKLFEQSPLSKQDQRYAHFQSGELHTSSKGQPLPAYVPASKTPLGMFGSYWRQALGLPASPKANTAGQVAKLKGTLSEQKAIAKDKAIRKALAKKGVR